MAASGPMADFARMPTSRKVLVFVVVGALIGFLYYRFGYKSLVSSLDKARAQHTSYQATIKTLDADIPKFNELRALKETLDKKILEHQKALPTESEVPAFFETLERKITEAGVEVQKWSKKPELPVENSVKVPLDVELTGTFLQIKRFFASLAEKPEEPGETNTEHERIVSIENLALTQPTVRNREIVLTAKFTAVTYRQNVTAESGPGAPGAPVPGSGPATPAMPSTAPPLPSAATPAGAKARTEKALQEGEQRTKDGLDKANGGSGSDRLKGGL